MRYWKNMVGFQLIFRVIFFVASFVCQSTQNMSVLRKNILDSYDNRYAPPEDKGEIYIAMNIALYLRTINAFDEVNGHLQTTTLLALDWHDNRLKWDQASTGINFLTFSSQEVWVPSLIIENSVSDTFLLDPELNYLITVLPDGWAQLRFPRVLDSKCYANVRFFPFDKHYCNISLGISESFSLGDLVMLDYKRLIGDLDILKPNAQWGITVGNTTVEFVEGVKMANFPLLMQRKSTFIVVTLIVPIIFLCLVNVLVFFIPPGSGERMSFAITVLLAFSVYMSIVSEKVPESDPMPLYNLFLVFKLTYSAVIALCGMISVRVYEKEGDIDMSEGMQNLVLCLEGFPCCCCRCGKRKRKYKKQNNKHLENKNENSKNSFSGSSVSAYNGYDIYKIDFQGHRNKKSGDSETELDEDDSRMSTDGEIPEVTWKTVSGAIDTVCWIVFSLVIVVEVVMSFVFTIRLILL